MSDYKTYIQTLDQIDQALLDAWMPLEPLQFPHDHGEISWQHFLAQHEGKVNTENFVKAFYPPLNELDRALNDLYTRRWMDVAVGDQLDGAGSIVGQTRALDHATYLAFFGFISQPSGRGFGQARMRRAREPYSTSISMGDADYRMAIKFKVALNNYHGTAEEMIYMIETLWKIDNPWVYDFGNAQARVMIDEFIYPQDPRYSAIFRNLWKAAGVKLYPVSWAKTHSFGFINQHMGYLGFHQGILARFIGSNIQPIGRGTDWDGGITYWDGNQTYWDRNVIP